MTIISNTYLHKCRKKVTRKIKISLKMGKNVGSLALLSESNKKSMQIIILNDKQSLINMIMSHYLYAHFSI